MDTDDELERARTLLTKAENARTPEETTIYNVEAAEQMARHSLDSAVLAAGAAAQDRVEFRRIPLDDPYSQERATLLGGIAVTMNCRAVAHPGPRPGQISSTSLIGFEPDLKRVEMTYTSLMVQATRSVVRLEPCAWSDDAAFRRHWLIGFSAEVHRMLSTAAHRAAADHDAAQRTLGGAYRSAEQVLADRRSLVDRAVADRFFERGRARQRNLADRPHGTVREAGRRAELDNARIHRSCRALGPERS